MLQWIKMLSFFASTCSCLWFPQGSAVSTRWHHFNKINAVKKLVTELQCLKKGWEKK